MPRDKPPVGKAHLVVAYVNEHGTRQELTSTIGANEAQALMRNAIEVSATSKVSTAPPTDEQLLSAFNSGETVLDGLHEVRALLAK